MDYFANTKINYNQYLSVLPKCALVSHMSSLPSFLSGALFYTSASQAIPRTYCSVLEKTARKLSYSDDSLILTKRQ